MLGRLDFTMSRQQRQKSHDRSAIQTRADRFLENPCRLTSDLVHALLGELCIEVGYCLPPKAHDLIEADPPTDPRSFADLVIKLEVDGDEQGDTEYYDQVLELVLRTFEGAETR